MNKLDKDYCNLLQDILDNGVKKETRNGGTISVFGRQIRHRMSDGFPLLTTKKMAWKSIVTELLWFLRGDTNIKFLVDNGCHIWDGDCYKRYFNIMNSDEYIETFVDPKLRDEARKNKGKNGYTKEEFINKIKTDDEFAKTWGSLGKIYGKQWRRWGYDSDKWIEEYKNLRFGSKEEIEHLGKKGTDQIANLINELKTNPDSRRLMVSVWNVGELDQMLLPPCHYSFQVYTRELSFEERIVWMKDNSPTRELILPQNLGPNFSMDEFFEPYGVPKRAISLMFNMRSNDVPLGLPFNIASYGLLLEIIAKMVNMVPDELIGNLGDCHIYTNQIDGIKEQLNREPYPLPKLNINTEWWPTEGGSCGEGPLDAQAILDGFSSDSFCKCLMEEDIQLYNYKSHPAIKMPLSN